MKACATSGVARNLRQGVCTHPTHLVCLRHCTLPRDVKGLAYSRFVETLLRAALHECFEGVELNLRYSDNSDVNDDVTEWL